ncbi:hypothetical protein CGZ92_06945 [Parenemella sanctibonifatiensis]|uniref:Phenylacetate--CoA ligase family protein n=1 Tax=Parenemella sanctibonifatiensis TaxID=2016505 RepID=A0A255E8T7_9ACTN|nr:hypothetical protein CGZ92_06945 [Parenemella sanctibonifatiensis]
MIGSSLRHTAAVALTRGQLEPVAAEVEAALRGGQPTPAKRIAIMKHALEQVPFYRRLGEVAFIDLPVVDKALIRASQDDFLAAGFDRSKLAATHTSGSTGIPFTTYQDGAKVLRHRGSLVANYRFVGADPWGPFLHTKQWGTLTSRQRWVMQLTKNHFAYAGVHQDPRPPASIAGWLKRHPGAVAMGYSSYLEGLFRAWDESGLSIPPGTVRAVVGISEPASPFLTILTKRLFGVSPRMRYSNMEMGLIAVSGEDMSVYHIDTSSFHVEILEVDSNRPADPGQSGRIVVTDLTNRAMPLLRYDTGDLGRFVVSNDGVLDRSRLTDIQGRRLDVIHAGDAEHPRRLHALQIWGLTTRISEIRQFQLRQHSLGHFTWILNAPASAELERRLQAILETVVGPTEHCDFTYVDEVPVLASGKRQFFVNEIEETP